MFKADNEPSTAPRVPSDCNVCRACSNTSTISLSPFLCALSGLIYHIISLSTIEFSNEHNPE